MRRKGKVKGRICMFTRQMTDECRVAKGEGYRSLTGDSTQSTMGQTPGLREHKQYHPPTSSRHQAAVYEPSRACSSVFFGHEGT